MHIMDRLFNEVSKKGVVCVGLDTHLDYIPKFMNEKFEKIEDRVFYFNKEIIEATKDIASIYKLQIAYYEAMGIEGLKAYKRTLEYLKNEKLLSIGDIKRSDISNTAKEYAKAHFEGDFEADFITLNPYMGMDSIEPFLPYLEDGDKGVFILLRTSNKGAKDIECLDINGEKLYFKVGKNIRKLIKKPNNKCGYSPLGFVVGATDTTEAKKIRKEFNDSFFLIPGYGAQGGKAKDLIDYLNDYNGAIVNSSRGIIKSHMKYDDVDNFEKFREYIRKAAINMREDIHGK